MNKIPMHFQIFGAILIGVPLGLFFNEKSAINLVPIYSFIGTLFLNALKMLVVPLIAAAIISSMSQMGQEKSFARLGFKTLIYYASTSLIAILIGLFFVNLLQPGIIHGAPAKELIGLGSIPEATIAKVQGKGSSDIWAVFLRMFPTNIVNAAAQGQMLGLISFSLLFGFFASRLKEPLQMPMIHFWNGAYEIMLGMTNLIMKFAPIGVMGLIAKTTANSGLQSIGPLALFFSTVILALGVHFFVFLPLLLFLKTKHSPIAHFQALSSALLTAFSTSSSAATLPKTMECLQSNCGVSKRVSSFTIPLGATVNMDGTALYECVAALFIAQAYGIEMSAGIQFTVVLVALLTSIGVAGIPSASLVAIVLILGAIGLPMEGIGLILAVDRVLDMCRTTVNVFSDSVGAVLIAHSEGETLFSK